MASYRDLELLVAKIQRQLAPDAKVLHDVKIVGRLSGVERQIDVLVEQNIGQYTIRIAIDSKDYATPVDVNGVGTFVSLINDTGVQKGVMVCPAGFTAAAKQFAKANQIELYCPIDTDIHKWTVRLRIPVVVDVRTPLFAFGCTFSGRVRLAYDFPFSSHAYGAKGEDLGTPISAAKKNWRERAYPVEPGIYPDLSVFNQQVLVDDGYGGRAGIGITASLNVTQQLYVGYLPIAEMSGFSDELAEVIFTDAFTTGFLKVDDIFTWPKIDSLADAPQNALHLRGLVGVEESQDTADTT